MSSHSTDVSVLGLGAMGRALAGTLLDAGHTVTVWNRTPGRDAEVVAVGAVAAAGAGSAAAASPLVVACLLDHTSVTDTFTAAADSLRGRTVVNLTSTTPEESRDLARWAERHDVVFLDGGIMATPEMIGRPESRLLYSGAAGAFDEFRPVLERFGTSEYLGEDPGLAALWDFALLAAMYGTFAAVFHGMAMVTTAGASPDAFVPRVTEWLGAMLSSVPYHAGQVTEGHYRTEVQSLDFNKAAVDAITRASRDAGIDTAVVEVVRRLVDREVAAGNGALAFSRIYESIRRP
ncbi:3-hydroxyisobutyrate dehydrogenase-like beta-hydroxyacid dehydrogenase [Stackebrandtia albiflava]|uniref:3-hydroxyisobutyrate dehydrogenase-like beta-hydroxyacid dehydrogenase n=1 Tax=Stackebrandtia albiflava TaxID=406432 RepID=A0A562V3F1_9ACTN|nr:NAD(P)-binding domain-containing protein [Stackebrandtia albiflava]TWJ12411.1 3-hydroxyisobutyrate dehydrogenase-like beta-hydroxyacid dehydrogenase [Stackebrandtia albiflava]